MTDKILYVDDDANILAAFQRTLGRTFRLETAQSGAAGLEAVARTGPYAVVISDLRMPVMDGLQFLARVHAATPDTVRIILTGNADVRVAIAAVNDGHIFRFLTKPVEPETLVATLRAGLEQYRLVKAEHDLLARTLHGCVKVLTDILSLVNPTAFSQTARLKRYVRHIAGHLGLSDVWLIEMAAMLSQIGCVSLPPDILEKVHAGQQLTLEEQQAYDSHPRLAHSLLLNIPRLGPIAEMIVHQNEAVQPDSYAAPPPSGAEETHPGPTAAGPAEAGVGALRSRDLVGLGAEILKAAVNFDRLVERGTPPKAAVRYLRLAPGRVPPAILAALEQVDVAPADMEPKAVALRDLSTGMILAQDVLAANRVLLVAKGQEITAPVVERLRRFAQTIGVAEPIRVLAPKAPRGGESDRTPAASEA